jgi:regulation of enolase protein 1 (concanavalin A-like superfamily)
MFEQCEWINEPPEWKMDDHQLQVITGGNTDFWRQTQYGFTRRCTRRFRTPVRYTGASDFTRAFRRAYGFAPQGLRTYKDWFPGPQP